VPLNPISESTTLKDNIGGAGGVDAGNRLWHSNQIQTRCAVHSQRELAI